MNFFTVDLFVDALILILHHNTPKVRMFVNRILEIYEAESKEATNVQEDFFQLYIVLIREVMSRNLSIKDTTEIETFLLKFKSNPLVLKDPELYTTLKKIFTDSSDMEDVEYQQLLSKISNSILWYENTKLVKRMFAKLAANNAVSDPNKQARILRDISACCTEMVRKNQASEQQLNAEQDATKITYLDFTDRDNLKQALQVFNTTSSQTSLFRTGLQGLNRALGGGFRMGQSIVFNSLAHHGKALRNNEPVKIPGGWKTIGEMRIGDLVTAWDGTTARVTGVFPQGRQKIYDVIFADGRHVQTEANHLWTVRRSIDDTDVMDTINTLELKKWLSDSTQHNVFVPLCESEIGPEDPTLGNPFDVGCQAVKNQTAIDTRYLHGSHHQRSLLQFGMRAGAGLVQDGEADFWSSSLDVAKDYQYLVRSFGGISTLKPSTRCVDDCCVQDGYVVTENYDEKWLQVTAVVEFNEKDECTCIQIDHPDKLFVTRDFIVTHNSLTLLKFARWQVTLNKAPEEFKNPTCIIYSLENETPQNMMQLFHELWINKYKEVPPQNISEEHIINFCYDEFSAHGWRLIIDRRLGAEFGFPELVGNFEQYISMGFTPLMCVIDYMNMMRKGRGGDDIADGNHLLVRELYTNVRNYLSSHNCTLVTAHQLNRKAAEAARLNPLGAVKRFGIDMLADATDPQREVDTAIYQHKEFDAAGRAWLTWKLDKNRYVNDTPDKHKYFAYQFRGPLGILDDIDGEDMSTDNINSVPFDNEAGTAQQSSRPVEGAPSGGSDGGVNLFS